MFYSKISSFFVKEIPKTRLNSIAKKNFIFGRNVSLKTLSTSRQIYVFEETNNYTSVPHIRHAKDVVSIFEKLGPTKSVDVRRLERELLTPQRSVLVVIGEKTDEPMNELYGLSQKIREAIFKGFFNYYGVGSGAIFAGQGYIDNGVPVHKGSFLNIANFMATKFPEQILQSNFYPSKHEKNLKVINKEGNSFSVHLKSGPGLEILTSEDTTRKIKKVASFTDDFFSAELGVSAVSGSYGAGKYFLETYKPKEQDYDEISVRLRKMSLKEGAEVVLETCKYKRLIKSLEEAEKI